MRRLGVLIALSCGGSASAHDFWVQPDAYWLQPHEATPMTLQVGHGPFRQRSPIPVSRITRFEAIGPDGTRTGLRWNLRAGGETRDGEFRLESAGTYVLVLQTDNRAQSHLPAIRFNDYLKVEGLTPALLERERAHRMWADGSENYSRCAKSLVQVGPSDAQSDAQITRPSGLPLEIVPERSPYAQTRVASLPVRVFYEGRPLVGASVKLTNLEDDANPLEVHLTDAAGRASFTMPQHGRWLLNVIWTKVLPPSSETEFETVFASLSFGFPAGPPSGIARTESRQAGGERIRR